MAVYYKLYGLLFVFMNCLKPPTMPAISAKTFVEEPKTDKSCYVPYENGILTTTVSMQDLAASVPLDQYTIAWNQDPDPDGTGTWPIYGTECSIYGDSSNRENARCKATFVYEHYSIFYKMEIKDLGFCDETFGLYAFVIDRMTDVIVARSSGTACFNVNSDCQLPIHIPSTKETDPDSHMEGIIWFTTSGKILVAVATFLSTILGYTYRGFRVVIKLIQIFLPDVYDFTREWFRSLWRRVAKKQFRDQETQTVQPRSYPNWVVDPLQRPMGSQTFYDLWEMLNEG